MVTRVVPDSKRKFITPAATCYLLISLSSTFLKQKSFQQIFTTERRFYLTFHLRGVIPMPAFFTSGARACPERLSGEAGRSRMGISRGQSLVVRARSLARLKNSSARNDTAVSLKPILCFTSRTLAIISACLQRTRPSSSTRPQRLSRDSRLCCSDSQTRVRHPDNP